ncbi:hypothetical protein TNCV_1018501 [Trichonephila clavipes]|nr:hypothetical protein TNCV_1018501 [Trichonephila clavipes]
MVRVVDLSHCASKEALCGEKLMGIENKEAFAKHVTCGLFPIPSFLNTSYGIISQSVLVIDTTVMCPYASNVSSNLQTHKQVHLPDRPFECNYCGNRFKALNDLNSHIQIHTGFPISFK